MTAGRDELLEKKSATARWFGEQLGAATSAVTGPQWDNQ